MPTLQQCDLSIIIPVYNLEKHIQPILDSLKAQKHGYSVEILFVLNNCTDKSEEIVRASGLGRILYCEEQGCGPARNAGLREARGKYIWFMDGDDWLTTDQAIQIAVSRAYQDDLDILYIPFESKTFRFQYFSMVWQYILRKDFIEGIEFPSIQPAEDDYFMDMVLRRKGINRWYHYHLPSVQEPLYFYNYMREGSNMYRLSKGEKI